MRTIFLTVFAVVLFIAACTKIESTTIGTGLIPPVDGVSTFDTLLDVYTNTFYDSLGPLSKVFKSDDHVIGVIDEPVFGKTTATTYFELKPPFYKYYFPADTSLKAESAVLIMSYKGSFGDTSIPQTWNVYEPIDSIKHDTTFGISKPIAEGALLGSATIAPNKLTDSVHDGFEDAKNQIRIKLDNSFAQRMIKTFDTSNNSTGAYDSDSIFRAKFKGFIVKPTGGGNALIRVNLLDTNTKLALFYNYRINDTASKVTKAVRYFRFSTGGYTQVSGAGNYITRDYSTGIVNAKFNSNDNDSVVYVQTNPGTFTQVKIPGLTNLPNMIIHRAELLAIQYPDPTADPGLLYKKFDAPEFLLISRYDTTNKTKRNLPNDLLISGGQDNFTTVGGYTIDRTVDNNVVKSYNFDLSRYVQGIVTRKDTSFTLRLSAPVHDSLYYTSPYPSNVFGGTYYLSPSLTNPIATGRVILGGGGMSAANPYRMRLRIIYSKL